ncbi:MAG: flagellar hook-basal body protein [Bacillota bacterium]|uniref:flagellar hook-basal body protein n=1 Tax=unclassified Virgibacillus TaxID=2620237 RepID=UPI0003FBE77B|nr:MULTISPECIES: flagellar hook-basal body protein [Bacillaceae]MCC2252311.1 flagellar hook-basal body protein [Virgibacillus sp. AGTR]MDY7046460.1 flagellar hook-basal body protein [Virgibacillus sp. M23]QRZ18501.1 flagellar hook-basal body protein [Virgibacillus sp. AGTR]
MLRGFYTAASGMIAQQRQQEAFSNNISNANTPGYKADQTSLRAFPEMLLNQMGGKEVPTSTSMHVPIQQPIGSLNTGVYVQETIPNFTQGDMRETGIATDLAIVNGELPDEAGSLFFTVQDTDGEIRYTRNGNFTVDGQGYLVTNQGFYVLDQSGEPIYTNGMEFSVTPDGLLQTPEQSVNLGVAYATDANGLTKEGNGLYAGDAADLPPGVTFSIKQGFLERSNVDSLQSMTQMMESYRLFETNQRVLKAYDESMGKAVSEIARLV